MECFINIVIRSHKSPSLMSVLRVGESLMKEIKSCTGLADGSMLYLLARDTRKREVWRARDLRLNGLLHNKPKHV